MFHRIIGKTLLLGTFIVHGAVMPQATASTWTVSGFLTVTQPGTVHLKLYAGDGEDAFRLTQEVAVDTAAVRAGRMPFAFEGVPSGTYALRAWQDVNGNGKLDTDAFGRPKEPWGTYRRSHPRFGGPQWKEMAFKVSASVQDIVLKLE